MSYCSPWCSSGPRRSITWRMIATYSRVRVKGFPNGTPCQPSTTCGPDGPMPQRNRLPDSACRVIAVIAAQAGVRAGICMMLVPALIRLVRARTQATGLTASLPYASPAHTASKPSRSASSTRSISIPAWPGENLRVVDNFIASSAPGQAPTPTLPRKQGRGFSRARRQLPPSLAGEGWGGGFGSSCQHSLAGAGDAFDGGEPVSELALGRLDEDMLDADCGVTLEARAQCRGVAAIPAVAQ